jgi:hypothetical protein
MGHGALEFPTPAANRFRGALGNNLREREDDAYERFFDPALHSGPSGLSDPPRPFVIRAAHLDGARVPKGEVFHFDLHLFDLRSRWPEVLAETLRLTNFAWLQDVMGDKPMTLDLSPAETVTRTRVRFLTPMELKSRGGLGETPEFGILAARIRDRVSTLRQLYGEGPLVLDFGAFGERAAAVKMTRCNVRRAEAQRRSGSTGQTHSLGGFVGEAEYEGDLTEFMPYLRAAQWTGVGRQTTWGKGAIAILE